MAAVGPLEDITLTNVGVFVVPNPNAVAAKAAVVVPVPPFAMGSVPVTLAPERLMALSSNLAPTIFPASIAFVIVVYPSAPSLFTVNALLLFPDTPNVEIVVAADAYKISPVV